VRARRYARGRAELAAARRVSRDLAAARVEVLGHRGHHSESQGGTGPLGASGQLHPTGSPRRFAGGRAVLNLAAVVGAIRYCTRATGEGDCLAGFEPRAPATPNMRLILARSRQTH
jgi:hypothetical protein